jgi:perosamine synthetase
MPARNTEKNKNSLALYGGQPAKTVPYSKGKRFGKKEEQAAVAAVRSQKLWFKQGGTRVAAVEKTITEMWKIDHAVCCSSGTAAVHTALVMCGVEPGDEVIVNPITDWGSILGILAIGAVPVFCDIDETTYSLDPACVARAITPKTRAIEVVHIFGYPAHIKEIVQIAHTRGIKVIEDCAQSPYAFLNGQAVGTFGDVGAFSTNDSKHISCGEGGFVVTRNAEMARIARQFIDKGYGAGKERGKNDVTFMGYNYRLSELAAAVLQVQLKTLPQQIKKRQAFAQELITRLDGIDGLNVPRVLPGGQGAYWLILSHLDFKKFKADRQTLIQALVAEGLAFWPALSPVRTVYGTFALREKSLYPLHRTPAPRFLEGADYKKVSCPVAEKIADSVLSWLCSPFYTRRDARETAAGIRKVLEYFHN